MNLSINPWYYCNFRCDFCYLTPAQLADKQLLPISVLSQRIAEVLEHEPVGMVDIYGGEIGVLPIDYWNEMIDTLHVYGIDDINLITNLSMVNDITTDERVFTSVSYDFDVREQSDKVFRNMALLDKPFSVLMLASPKLIAMDVEQMIAAFNTLTNLVSVEIKPYSSNQANQLDCSYTDYENFVKRWITSSTRAFDLSNEHLLDSVVNRSRNAFSDDHVYITPSGKYGVLEFDLNDNEYFLEYDSIEQYFQWCEQERVRVSKNQFCSACKYYGSCLSEHLREVKTLDNGCNGMFNLIEWYSNGK